LVKKSKPTVAIFGGSFDPPHLGHQQIVHLVLNALSIDKLFVVPAYLNPFKTDSMSKPLQRLQWCKILFDDIPKVNVQPYEIEQKRSTTTFETINYFNLSYEVKYLIIGSDNLVNLKKWHKFKKLNEQIIWVIITRKNYNIKVDFLREYKILYLEVDISSTKIREEKTIEFVDKKIHTTVNEILKGQ